ncbi:MAG: glycosyltransferase [Burkholderiaceae bacterium]|nr:MAG: glycosyltransferase [Burkholderiaceae bacterium]TBR75658.1 MAG: glycosyltransferase [Burkholderiaceae bacterium]
MAIAHDDAHDSLQQVQVAVLAKAPIPGLAKTRLIPVLGPRGAARLQRRLTRAAVQTARDANVGPVTLWCTPDAGHRFFKALQSATNVRCLVQPSGDLGDRMHTAFRLLCAQGPLLLIGTDCPVLRPAHLRKAARALIDGDDAVFYPAEDGGYVLVGLRQPQAALFTDMTWGTATVMSDTRERARALDLRLCEFEALWDVDVPDDLARLDAVGTEAAA